MRVAMVMKVGDGGTFCSKLPSDRKKKVRFIGVDVPERAKEVGPYGGEAAVHTNKRLPRKRVWLEFVVQ